MQRSAELQYLDVMRSILAKGDEIEGRNGTTTGVFAPPPIVADMARFPLLTSKFVSLKNVCTELEWFLQGQTNIQWLHDRGCKIWDEWADEGGNVGPIYGHQWRRFGSDNYSGSPHADGGRTGIDQLSMVQESLRHNPHSRRHVISAWNPLQEDEMGLPPCHILMQFYAGSDNSISMQMYQRSADWFLGVPYNLASYGLLLHFMGAAVGRWPKTLTMVFGDAHIYKNHENAVKEQLSNPVAPPPTLGVRRDCDLLNVWEYGWDDVTLQGYRNAGVIKAPVSA